MNQDQKNSIRTFGFLVELLELKFWLPKRRFIRTTNAHTKHLFKTASCLVKTAFGCFRELWCSDNHDKKIIIGQNDIEAHFKEFDVRITRQALFVTNPRTILLLTQPGQNTSPWFHALHQHFLPFRHLQAIATFLNVFIWISGFLQMASVRQLRAFRRYPSNQIFMAERLLYN